MRKPIMKSLVALSLLAVLFGGSDAFAGGTGGKTGATGAKRKIALAHPKTVKITVSKDGFSPSSISVEKGYPVTLVFTRADNKNCGSKVVFPSLKITKALPVGKEVTVKITPDKEGEIAFTCGMGMMKGAIVAH